MKTMMALLAATLASMQVLAAPAGVGDYPLQAERIAPDVYAVVSPARDFPDADNRGWNSNAAFVVAKDGVLVIDTGSSETIGRALREAIAGVTDLPVRWIINTHGHGDHWLGNAALADARTEIISSSTVKQRIEREGGEWVERFKRLTNGATGDSRVLAPRQTYDAWTAIAFSDVKVELLPAHDAHSPGDLVVWLPRHRVLFGGDVVYVERAPATFDARIQPWIAILKELEALGPAVVVPGHGPVASGAAVPRLRHYFEELWQVVASGQQAGQADFEILPRARVLVANRHARYFPDYDKRLGETVSHITLQVEAASFK